MPLAEQIIPLVLDVGIDVGADPKTIVGLTRAENAMAVRRGELRKRYGQSRSASAVSGLSQMFAYGQGLVAIGQGVSPRVYSPSADTWTEIQSGGGRYFIEHEKPQALFSSTTVMEGQADVIRNGDVLVFAAVSGLASVDSQLRTFDARTFRPISALVAGLSCSSWLRLVTIGGLVRCYYVHNGACVYREISAAGAIGNEVTVTTVTSPDSDFGLCDATTIGTYVFLSWHDATANKFKLAILPGGGDTSAITVDLASTATPLATAVCLLDSTTAMIVYSLDDGGTSKTWATAIKTDGTISIAPLADPPLHSTTSTVTSVSCIGRNHQGLGNAGTAYVCYDDESYGTGKPRTTAELSLTGSNGTYNVAWTTTKYRHYLLSKPCPIGSAGWLVAFACETERVWSGTAVQRTVVLYSGGVGGGLLLSGRLYEGVAYATYRPCLHSAYGSSYGYLALPHMFSQRRGYGGYGAGYVDANVYRVSAVQLLPHTVQGIESDGVLHLSGSCPLAFDGELIAEQGFIHYPSEASIDRASSTGGGLTIGGTYSYKLTYEHFDAAGRRTESVPTPVAITPANPPSSDHVKMSIVVPTPQATERSGRLYAVAWRTIAGGTIYYRAAAALANPANATVTISDQVTDSTLQGNAQLYTTGGALENEPPPPHAVQTLHQGRHIVSRMDAPDRSVRYSRVKFEQEPYLHSGVLDIPINEDGGSVSAIIETSDKLIVAKHQRLYAVEGEGLADNGSGAGYVAPYLLSPSVGCIDWRTIARIPQGTLLLGEDAIWLLSGALQTTPIGDPVRYYTDTLSVVQALVLSERGQAVFLTSDGSALVYDWIRNRWLTWTGMQSISGAVLSDTLYRLDASGYVWRQDSGHDDNGSHVALAIETTWLSPWGTGAWGRVREIGVVGQYVGTCQLTLQVGFDFEPAWHPAQTIDLGLQKFDVDSYYGPGLTLATYQNQGMVLNAHPPRRRCTAFRVRVIEVADGLADTAGVALSAIVVRVAQKAGLSKAGASRKIGG